MDDGSSGWFLGVGGGYGYQTFCIMVLRARSSLPTFCHTPTFIPFLAYFEDSLTAHVGGSYEMPVYDHDASPFPFVDLATTR